MRLANRKNETRRILSLLKTVKFSLDFETKGVKKYSKCVSAAISIEGGEDLFFDLKTRKDKIILRWVLRKTLFNPMYQGRIIFHGAAFDVARASELCDRMSATDKRYLAPNIEDTHSKSFFLHSTKHQNHVDHKKRHAHALKLLEEEWEINLAGRLSYDDIAGNRNIDFVPLEELREYNIQDTRGTLELNKKLDQELIERGLLKFYNEVWADHCFYNVYHMSQTGLNVDRESLLKATDCFLNAQRQIESDLVILTGQSFDIGSNSDLASFLYYNHKFPHREKLGNSEGEFVSQAIRPPRKTEKGSIKIDLQTLMLVRKRAERVDVVDLIIFWLELNQAVIELEKIRKALHKTHDSGYKLFSSFKATAISLRLRSSDPNIFGFPKRSFKVSNYMKNDDYLSEEKCHQPSWISEFKDQELCGKKLTEFSPRRVIVPPNNNSKILSVDAKAIDLNVIAHLAGIESWIKIFKLNNIDFHFEILRTSSPRFFKSVFEVFCSNNRIDLEAYYVGGLEEKGGKRIIKFTLKSNQDKNKTVELKDGEYQKFEDERNICKKVNLSIPYGTGAANLAVQISLAIGDTFLKSETEKLLKEYYKNNPEIRKFQDRVGEAFYREGFFRPHLLNLDMKMGAEMKSNTWFDLNSSEKSEPGRCYEFVLYKHHEYWYVKARGMRRSETSPIENLRYTDKPFGLYFDKVEKFLKLDKKLFIKKDSTLLYKPSEDDTGAENKFKKSYVAISCEINRFLESNLSQFDEDDLWDEVRKDIYRDGKLFLDEKQIILYRITGVFRCRYFRPFKGLLKETKKIFPTICQSGSAMMMARAISYVRKKIEILNLVAKIFLSVHDSIDCYVPDKEMEGPNGMKNILLGSLKKILFNPEDESSFIPLTGDLDPPMSNYK